MSKIKALFVDYSGTLVEESDQNVIKVIKIISEHSILKNPKDILTLWWGFIHGCEQSKTFIPQEEIIKMVIEEFRLKALLDYD